jgi:GH15 family glucan-1,4-alpha-glucosidase
LVGRDGAIDWWCAPRFDSRSTFARLLDAGAGHWSIRPRTPYTVERRYLAGTMVLETTFGTEGGVLRLTDALALEPDARGHDIGLRSPHALVRLLDVPAGDVEVEFELAPRFEYGLVTPGFVETADGCRTLGGPDAVFLSLIGVDSALETGGGAIRQAFRLRSGDRAGFALQHRVGVDPPAPEPLAVAEAIDDAIAGWRSWEAEHARYEGPYPDQVRHSALVLQALTYQPTGAIAAAPTTSLPEIVGGSWNWDYRYAWLRDASLTLHALWVAACPDEAERYFSFMARAASACRADENIQVVYALGGERNLAEQELDHLAGYRASRPVRVGNGAWRQRQLDVPGEVLDAAHVLHQQIGTPDPFVSRFLCELADRAARDWREPDSGIWEGREGERQYLSSKLLAWVALDRAVKLERWLGCSGRDHERWRTAREKIRGAILAEGWNEELGAYTGAIDSDRLDSSVLLLPIFGLVAADDPRMRSTVAALERELGHGALLRRWTDADDGAFVACSYWLADVLARGGSPERAREVFEAVTAHANDVGLLSEEIEVETGELIGNFPQGFSHVALINAAWSITRAEGEISDGDTP